MALKSFIVQALGPEEVRHLTLGIMTFGRMTLSITIMVGTSALMTLSITKVLLC